MSLYNIYKKIYIFYIFLRIIINSYGRRHQKYIVQYCIKKIKKLGNKLYFLKDLSFFSTIFVCDKIFIVAAKK